MRVILLVAAFLYGALCFGQGSGFSFSYNGPTQIIVGPDCEAELDWGHPNTPTASSNLPGGMITSFEIYSISGGYEIGDMVFGGNTVTVFYQAMDNFGNSSLFGFSIAFIDLLPPVFDPLSLPPNLTVNCTGNFPVAEVEVSDNCEEENLLTLTFSESNNALPCTGGTITRTWLADDDLGNTAVFVQTITVLPDNTPPVIANNLQHGTSTCATAMAQYTAWLNTQRANFSATDNGCGIMTLSDNAPSPSLITSFCGEIMVTFTAKDNCNNISTVIRTFTITNNIPPVIHTPAADASGNCSQANIAAIFNNWISTHGGATATDDCSSIFWTTIPPSPSLNDTCNAAIHVIFLAGDGCGNADTTSASFFLTDDTPPAITAEPSTMLLSCSASTVDSLLMDWLLDYGHSSAHDLCTSDGDLVKGFRISGNDLSFPEVLEAWEDSLAAGCNDNVIIDGVGINNVKAYLEVDFVYDDQCNNEVTTTGFFGITDNGRPTFVTNPSDTSFTCSENNNWVNVFEAWFASAGNATYTDQCSNVTVQSDITADSALQYLAAALDTACGTGAGITIQFLLSDECGNMSLLMPSATFSLQDTIPPVLITPATDLVASCSLDGQTQLNNWLDTLGGAEASDGCGQLTWIFTWIDTAGQMNQGIPGAGPYPDTSALDCTSGFDVVFTASDACDNTVSDTAFFSLIDTLAPVFLIAQDSVSLGCQDTISSDLPEVSDNCGGEIELIFSDAPGIDSCLGLPETVIRTWTATDECGNVATAQIVFLRTDTLPPTFILPDESVEFCSVDTLMLIDLQDNCDPSPVATFEDVLNGIPCEQTLFRTWTVSDACGNTATAEQIFDLSDETPPQIVHSPGDFVFTCEATENVQEAYEQWRDSVVIQDGCSDADYFIAVPGSYILDDTSTWPGTPLADSVFLSCDIELLIEGDLVVFDVCGNVTVSGISFSVHDTTPPVFVNCIELLVVEPDTASCTGIAHLEVPAVTETCYPGEVEIVLVIDGGDTISLDTITELDTVLSVGIHQAVWIASDCKGNTSSCITTIGIIDENAVTLTCPGDTLLFTTHETCTADLFVFPPADSTGKCGKGTIELRFEIMGIASPDSMVFEGGTDSVLVSFGAGINEVLLIARDSTGDIDTCRYIVELRDTIDPVIVCHPDTLILHPSGLEEIDLTTLSLASVTDNCSIHSVVFDPPMVNCADNNNTIDVSVVAFDQSGNSAFCNATLFVMTAPLMPQWSIGLCDDTLRLFANIPPGPSAEYTFLWNGPNAFVSGEENPVIPDADSTFSGIYTVTVTSENGCVSSGSVAINIETLSAPVITISDDTICAGREIILTTQTYTGAVTYQWHHITPEGDTVMIETQEAILNLETDAPGDHSFFAIVIQDTCFSAAGPALDLYVRALPVASIADLPAILCPGDSLFLAPSVVVDSFSYEWTASNGFISNEPAPPGIPAADLGDEATFTLTVNDGHCHSLADSIIVATQQPLATPVIQGDSIACEEGSFTLQATPVGVEFEWIDPSGNSIFTDSTIFSIPDATTSHTGFWFVIGYLNGCASDTSEGLFVQIDTAIQVEINADHEFCEGDSITLAIDPFIDGTYTWGGPGGFASDEISPTTLATTGIYFVSLLTATGCEAADSLEVSVSLTPAIASIQTDADSCADGMSDVRLWASVSPPGIIEYFWNGPGGFSSQDSSPVIANFTSSLNGIYSLYVINGPCISDTVSIHIEVTDSPAAPIIIGENVFCFGDTIILQIESPIPNSIYTWTSSDTSMIVESPGSLIIPDGTPSLSGIYRVSVNIDGCVSPQTPIAVQVRPLLAPPLLNISPIACEGDSLVLNSNAPAGAILHWTGPGGFESNETSPVLFPVTTDHAGAYAAYYELNGCFSDTSAISNVTVQSILTTPILLTASAEVCIDDPREVILCIDQASFTPGASYTWLVNGAIYTANSADTCITILGTPLTGGNNMITAFTTLQGCISETSVPLMITGHEIPSQNANAGPDQTYCPGEEIVLQAGDPGTSTGIWTSSSVLVVIDQETSPVSTVAPLPSGEYVLTWTLSFESCIDYASDSMVLGIIPSPVVLPDTFDIPFGQTMEFVVVTNDTLSGIPFTLSITSNTTKGNVLHAGNGVFRYTPNVGFVGTDAFIYRICSAECPEECEEAAVILHVGNEDDCFVPTLFTPNGDGINDNLIVPCLETERFPSNKIIIFNEWGDVVFTASPYLNDWDGRSSGESLPVGTYFYIMDFGDGSTPRKTFLVLER